MRTMNAILAMLNAAPATRASVFASMLQDDSFNGVATANEMDQFCASAMASCARVGQQPRVTAIAKLRAFALLPGPIRFPHLHKNIIIYQLVIRILQPHRVNQMRYGLCGPAHFIVLLIKSKPEDYADLAIGFMRDGEVNQNGLRIRVDASILNHRIPANFIPEADWVVAASLRNSKEDFPQSKVVDIPGSDSIILPGGGEGTYSGTTASQICKWLKDAGYSRVVGVMNFYEPQNAAEFLTTLIAESNFQLYYPEKPHELQKYSDKELLNPMINLIVAQKLCTNAWLILMKVNEAWSGTTATTNAEVGQLEQLLSAPQERAIMGLVRAPKDNHWIFVKKIEFNQSQVRMTIYTYGAKKTLPFISTEVFLANYGGFIGAWG